MKTARTKPGAISKSVTQGSGNVFTDLGFPAGEAADLKVKAALAMQIRRRIGEFGLTQTNAAKRLGLTQPDGSKLMNGLAAGYSTDRLLTIPNTLQVDIDIVVKPKPHEKKAARGVVRVLESLGA